MYAIRSYYEFVTSGIEIGGNNNDNLVLKAFRKIAGHEPKEGWYIHLHKIIPMGAGLGGGSADAVITSYSIHYTKLYEIC